MMRNVKAILGATSALFAFAALANILIYLTGNGATNQSGTARMVMLYTVMFIVCAGLAIYLLRAAFGKPRNVQK